MYWWWRVMGESPAMPDRERAVHVLVLGGTAEGRLAAAALAHAGFAVTLSLAGLTSHPRLPQGMQVRTGGFGGAAGLKAWLNQHGARLVVDCTHPFAARISRNATLAARDAGAPILRWRREDWRRRPGDRWIKLEDATALAAALPKQGRGVAMLGARGLQALKDRGDLWLTARTLMPPDFPVPPRWRLISGLPPVSLARELALLRAVRAEWLVCRASGGAAGYAKVAAARYLRLPVFMLAAPEKAHGKDVSSIEELLREVRAMRQDRTRGPESPGSQAGENTS